MPGKPTSNYPALDFEIKNQFEFLVKDKLEPWYFLTSGKMKPIKNFYGKEICYFGVEFEGTPRIVFWGGFIEPFLEDLFPKAFDKGFAYATKNKKEAKPVITHVYECLTEGIERVYMKMQNIDRTLRGKGYPCNVPVRGISDDIKRMRDKLEGYYNSALLSVPRTDTSTPQKQCTPIRQKRINKLSYTYNENNKITLHSNSKHVTLTEQGGKLVLFLTKDYRKLDEIIEHIWEVDKTNDVRRKKTNVRELRNRVNKACAQLGVEALISEQIDGCYQLTVELEEH